MSKRSKTDKRVEPSAKVRKFTGKPFKSGLQVVSCEICHPVEED